MYDDNIALFLYRYRYSVFCSLGPRDVDNRIIGFSYCRYKRPAPGRLTCVQHECVSGPASHVFLFEQCIIHIFIV